MLEIDDVSYEHIRRLLTNAECEEMIESKEKDHRRYDEGFFFRKITHQ